MSKTTAEVISGMSEAKRQRLYAEVGRVLETGLTKERKRPGFTDEENLVANDICAKAAIEYKKTY